MGVLTAADFTCIGAGGCQHEPICTDLEVLVLLWGLKEQPRRPDPSSAYQHFTLMVTKWLPWHWCHSTLETLPVSPPWSPMVSTASPLPSHVSTCVASLRGLLGAVTLG